MAGADGALRGLLTLAVAVVALAFPFVASGYHIYQGAQVLILAIALLGLNLLTGFNGQISLGHGAFFAIGSYGAAILIVKFGWPYWAAIPLASVVCFIAGFLFGFPALRFGGLYLALATFAQRGIEGGVAAQAAIHFYDVLLADAEPLRNRLDLVVAQIALIERRNPALGLAQIEEQLLLARRRAHFHQRP